MGYSSGGDGGVAKTEAERQARIDAGMTVIKRRFDGGTFGTGLATEYKPGTTYFDKTGQAWAPPEGTNPELAYRQAIANKLLFTGTKTNEGFGEDYYNQRANDYLKFATPKVMDDYRATKNNLAYALARNGNLNSSSAITTGASLEKELARNESNLANAAQGQANAARAQVADQRSNLVNQLVASADPSLVAEQAQSATAEMREPGAFQPIGNLFQDWTNTYLANMNARAYDPETPSLWKQMSSIVGN